MRVSSAVLPRSPGVHQLRDAEVEQLRRAAGRDQDIGRLDVAMDDQVLMRVLDRGADLEEERQARAQVEALFVAVLSRACPRRTP